MIKKKWIPINLIDYFIPRRGKESNMASLQEGSIPLISAKSVNNGLKGFVNVSEDLVEGNVITLNNDGDGGAGLAYYQPTSMALDSHVTALIAKQDVNENAQIYIACCLSGLHDFFGHGRSISNSRVEQIKVMLPVNNGGVPDWNYMTSCINDKRYNMLLRYKKYAENRIKKLKYEKIGLLNEAKWKSFDVSYIFDEIERGKRIKKADQIKGLVPYVSSTSFNNGVDGFIEASIGTRIFSDCISLANSGSVGVAFYEPFKFVASDHVTHLKCKKLNQWHYLFLSCVIEKQKANFNFNREINDSRIRKMKIMLPVSSDGLPDYKYMEQYAMNMMKRKYEQYIKYINNKI